MKLVKATREGLTGDTTATGWRISSAVPAVALPSEGAKYQAVLLRNPANGAHVLAYVLDVGPWNTADDAYVFGTARPQAESGTDTRGRKTNGAGIDLSELAWHALGMIDNGLVAWAFAWELLDLSQAAELLAGAGTH